MTLHPRVLDGIRVGQSNRPDVSQEAMEVLTVRDGSGSLGDLAGALPSLVTLGIKEWDDLDLNDVTAVSGLMILDLWDCPIRDLSPLAKLDDLEDITLLRCNATDLRPIEHMSLDMLFVSGCPLDDYSYLEVLPRLREKGVRTYDAAHPEPVWRLSRRLHERGLGAIAWLSDHGELRLSVPGLSGSKLGFAQLEIELVGEILDEHADLDDATFLELVRARRKRQREAEGAG